MWWTENNYNDATPIPNGLLENAGPMGVAVTRLHPNGKTDPGWGMSGRLDQNFMHNYKRGVFNAQHWLQGYAQRRWALAFVMRSMRIVCIDIDGKNGGLVHVGKLGMLPLTLAETSKSGNGYHLFYLTGEDEWNEDTGFAQFKDRIGIQQGVDFRATGCVFHHSTQRWNNRQIVELPDHLKTMLLTKRQKEDAMVSTIAKTLEAGDEEEIVLMRDALVDDLDKPIPSGRRNTTLFAVGSQMMLAGVPDWKKLVSARARAVGLDADEVLKLMRNITKYGANA